MTTNEYYKWRQVHKWYNKERKKYLQALKEGKIVNAAVTYKNIDAVQVENARNHAAGAQISDGDVGCVGPIDTKLSNRKPSHDGPILGEEREMEEEKKEEMDASDIVDPGARPRNIYNLGMLQNFGEILYPRSLRTRSGKAKRI
jgi:hypothetical protein